MLLAQFRISDHITGRRSKSLVLGFGHQTLGLMLMFFTFLTNVLFYYFLNSDQMLLNRKITCVFPVIIFVSFSSS